MDLYKVVIVDNARGFFSPISPGNWQLKYSKDEWTKGRLNSKIFLFDIFHVMEDFIERTFLHGFDSKSLAVFQVEAVNPIMVNVKPFYEVVSYANFWKGEGASTLIYKPFRPPDNPLERIVLADKVMLKKRVVKLPLPFEYTWRTVTTEEEARLPGSQFM